MAHYKIQAKIFVILSALSVWKVLYVPPAPEKATDMLTQPYTHAEFAWIWG